jgi:DNA modification methylase
MQNVKNISSSQEDEVNLSKLIELLSGDLDFHDQNSSYASHNFHSFAAKFPPQLPAKFIAELTEQGETVLDPMLGSGTAVLEAYLCGRFGIGFDIDPLALMIAGVKVTPINIDEATQTGHQILKQAIDGVSNHRQDLEDILKANWDPKTKEFVDYWFEHDTQIEIMALLREIRKIVHKDLKSFFELTLSGIIITKSGGVSLALDLAHTRPHRAKAIFHKVDRVKDDNLDDNGAKKFSIYSTKYLHSALWEFGKKFQQNLNNLPQPLLGSISPHIEFGNAKNLPLDSKSVDLVVTSPPYPSNAIDYMRAHKFSLVWLGYTIDDLSQRRKRYIGSDALNNTTLEELPDYSAKVVSNIRHLDQSKGISLHRYYSEMTQSLREMYRVLRPGKSAIVVVGSSIVRGIDTETAECLKEIGKSLGFEIPKIGLRKLDRDRRMMPAQYNPDLSSQIQQRMHEEYVIGCYKPTN